jgi:solute:Na+ symporter, SSS family
MNISILNQNVIAALGASDILVIFIGVVPLFFISYLFGRKENDTGDFFLGRRKVPVIVACMSFVATEVSALTIVGVPATAFSENWEYLQFFIGSAAARITVAFLFIPVFYKYQCTSIYEFLKHRFGTATQRSGSIFFFVTRLTASGVRLYATCMAVSYILNWNLVQAILLFTVVSIIFIGFGGIKAVVWAGAYQASFFFIAGIVLVSYLLLQMQGGFTTVWQIAHDAGRLSVFKFDFNLNEATTFWAGTANAFFIGLAVFGTDQEMVQRLLTVETRKKSQKTMIATIIGALPILCLYLSIGTLLYVFYQQNPDIAGPQQAKEVLSHFITNSLPTGLKGLILSAIILASIDSPLNSLSCSFVTDIYRPLINKSKDEKHYLFISRLGVIFFGIILGIIAYSCSPVENILWFAFQIVSLTGGAMLGVFAIGVLTKRKGNLGNVFAMVFSTFAMTALLLLSNYGMIKLAWSWLIVVGTATTFILSYLFSLLSNKRIRL